MRKVDEIDLDAVLRFDDTGVLQADKGDEQTDADGDGAAYTGGNTLEYLLADVDQFARLLICGRTV